MTAALEGVSGQQHAPAALYPREIPGTHFTGGWAGPRAGLDGTTTTSNNMLLTYMQTQQCWSWDPTLQKRGVCGEKRY